MVIYDREAERFVEAARIDILLVHINGECAAPQFLRVRHQTPTTPASTVRRVHEQCGDRVASETEKANGEVCFIRENPQITRRI